MTEYIFKHNKLLPLPEVDKPDENDYYSQGFEGDWHFLSKIYDADLKAFNNWLSNDLKYSPELKLEVGKVYKPDVDFKIVRSKQIYFTDQQQYQQMSMEEKEAQFEHIAIPVSTAQNETAILSEKSLAKDWDKEDDKKWSGFLSTAQKEDSGRIKNAPKKIYLVMGFDEDCDFNDLDEVAWCSSRQYDSDIEYALVEKEESVIKNEGGHYYDLFKFFNEQHNLLLLDSEIQDIIHAVEKFQGENETHWKGEAEHWYSEAHRLQKINEELQKIIDENNGRKLHSSNAG